jgi:hypothetical protein
MSGRPNFSDFFAAAPKDWDTTRIFESMRSPIWRWSRPASLIDLRRKLAVDPLADDDLPTAGARLAIWGLLEIEWVILGGSDGREHAGEDF